MALFKKKNKQADIPEEKDPKIALNEQNQKIKADVLNALNEKLKGTLYDNCIIMPKGFTVDVQIGRTEERDDIKLAQVVFIVKNDDFDEPLIDPVDAQGPSYEEAAKMAADIFYAGVWHPLEQSMTKKNPIHISVDFLRQHYDFDMYCQSVVRIGVPQEKKPVMLVNYLMGELPKYIGSKKYYWLRIYLAKFKDKKIIEVRVNGSVCVQLGDLLKPYIDSWEDSEMFVSEKQYAIFVQREDDKCPFTKETVLTAARQAMDMMTEIKSREEYLEMAKKLEEMTGDVNLASEIRIFIPEIFAKLTLGYREGDSLFLLEGEGEEQTQIEFKKTQLRSYFYLQQAVLEFLSKKPEQEKVTRIVANSVAFREMRKAHLQMKEQGREIKASDLFVPGTSYKIGQADYKVW